MIAGNRDGVPLVALDLDGTLGDYHAHFLWFAEQYFDRKFPEATQINPGLRLWDFMGITREEYRKCKLAYRQGGMKRWMPAYPGVAELTQSIHNLGADVWICTTRPFNKLDNIDEDTQEWLRRNEVEYEGLIFGEEKYFELRRQTHNRRAVLAVAEDLPELYEDALAYGFKTILRDQPYNKHVSARMRAHSCLDILNWIINPPPVASERIGVLHVK